MLCLCTTAGANSQVSTLLGPKKWFPNQYSVDCGGVTYHSPSDLLEFSILQALREHARLVRAVRQVHLGVVGRAHVVRQLQHAVGVGGQSRHDRRLRAQQLAQLHVLFSGRRRKRVVELGERRKLSRPRSDFSRTTRTTKRSPTAPRALAKLKRGGEGDARPERSRQRRCASKQCQT